MYKEKVMNKKVISTIVGVTLAAIAGAVAVLPNDKGIWVSQSEIMSRPTTGAAWNSILSDAAGSWGTANVSNQDSDHDQYVLAGALVCARTGQYCDKTRQGLLSAIGTESDARWLAVGRNMLGYTIAADVMRNSGNLTGADLTSVSNWLANFLTRTLANNNSGVQEKLTPFGSGSNASAQEGAVYAAIAAYTGNSAKLSYVWNRFRLYSCDRVGNPEQVIDVRTGFNGGWSFAANIGNACPVNPIGEVKNGVRIDGAIINDMVRGGSFKFPPGYTSYPWVGLEGYVPAALILQRAGYPSFAVGDNAVLRTHEYLCYLKNNTTTDWWEPSRAAEVKHLVKIIYGFDTCGVAYPVGGGRTVGYTDWTHPLGSTAYYVSPFGNDSNNGTQSAPFRTIQKAADVATGAVYVQAGNYPERVTVTRPLAFLAQGDVVMRGFTVTADNVTIRGFEITDTPDNDTAGWGIIVRGNNCFIEDNYIHYATRGGIYLYAPTNTETNGCVVKNNRLYRNSQLGIEVNGTSHLIENNEVWGTIQYHPLWVNPPSYVDADGMRFFGSGHVFRGNYIHDITLNDPENINPHIDAFQTWDEVVLKAGSNTLFENNRISLDFESAGWQLGGGAHDLIIRNNVVEAFAGVRGYRRSVAPFTAPYNLTITNNIFVGDLSYIAYPVGVTISNGAGIDVSNNILYNQADYTIDIANSTGVQVNTNLAYNSNGQMPRSIIGAVLGNNLWGINPLLDANYRPLAGSPACLSVGYIGAFPCEQVSITSTWTPIPPSATPTRTPTVTASIAPTRTPTATMTATITVTNTVPPPGSLTCVFVTWTRGLNLRPTPSMDNTPYYYLYFGYGAVFPVQRIFENSEGKWMQVNEHLYSAMYLNSNRKIYAIEAECPQG